MLKLQVVDEICLRWIVFLAGIAEPSLPMHSGFMIKPISPSAEYLTLLNTISKCAYVGLDVSGDMRSRTMNKRLSTDQTGQDWRTSNVFRLSF